MLKSKKMKERKKRRKKRRKEKERKRTLQMKVQPIALIMADWGTIQEELKLRLILKIENDTHVTSLLYNYEKQA